MEQIMKTMILAGEVMLQSGAETYRVEDTLCHMLHKAGAEQPEVIVMMTGFVVTVTDEEGNIITASKRVPNRGTNLTNVGLVNEISRKYCSGELTLQESHERLEKIKQGRHKPYTYTENKIAMGCAVVGFSIMFGGKWNEMFVAVFAGIILGMTFWIGTKAGISDLILNPLSSFGTTTIAIIMKAFLPIDFNMETVIVSALMPLVPGVAITNAIRDTLRGDYLAGGARILEAFLTAAVIATGVGFAMSIFGTTLIGRGKL